MVKQGIEIDKILNVSNKIMMTNKIAKRFSIFVEKGKDSLNAYPDLNNKNVAIYSGII